MTGTCAGITTTDVFMAVIDLDVNMNSGIDVSDRYMRKNQMITEIDIYECEITLSF